MPGKPTIHASAVLVGARAVLIRGPSGSGKSSLAVSLIEAGQSGVLPFARLVGDDRVFVEAAQGRLLVRAPDQLHGLVEVRGLGIRRLPFEAAAVVGLVVDLGAPDTDRLPGADAGKTVIEGVQLARLAVASGYQALPLVLAAFRIS